MSIVPPQGSGFDQMPPASQPMPQGYPGFDGMPGYPNQGYPNQGLMVPRQHYGGLVNGHGGGFPPAQAPPGGLSGAGGTDVIGPIMRRKFLVIFLGLIGLGVGYLAYINAPVIYESGVRLMITTHVPPAVVNGEMLMQRVSLPKHEKLLSSQLVLSKAVEQGKFAQLPMFQGRSPEALVGALQGSVLSVIPSKNREDETLTLTAKGQFPEDLPTILNFVVQTYRDEIAKDSKNSSQESVELINKLLTQLKKEKQDAESEYVAILRRLDMPGIEQGNQLVNPYNEELAQTTRLRTEVQNQITDYSQRLELLRQAAASADETRITYLVAEAKKFLDAGVETAESLEERRINNQTFAGQLFSLERELTELSTRRDSVLRRLGKRHPMVMDLNQRVYNTQEMLTKVRKQQQAAEEAALSAEEVETLEEKLERRNRKWIAVYEMALQTELSRLAQKLTQLDDEINVLEGQARLVAGDFLQLTVLKSRVAEKQRGIDEVLAQLSQLDVLSNNFTDTKVRVIDPAGVGRRVAPVLLQHLGIGFAIGAMLGIALAVLIDRSDMTYRNPGEIFDRLKVPVVSRIPGFRINRRESGGAANPALAALYKPTSKMAEAVRAARTSILFTAHNTGAKVFLFTSPSPGDGKSTATANLAISLAQAGKKVVLVDSDFRRPRVHVYFGQKIEPGILQVTSGVNTIDEAVRESEQEGLWLLPAGGRPKNPGEVVTSQLYARMLTDLREQFDIVLIDSPPVLPVSDATVISSLVDGVYMIIRIRKGVVVTSSKSKEKLDMVNANLLGVIVNGVDDNPHYNEYGSYGYGYGYGSGGSSFGNGNYYETRNSRYQEKLTMKD